MKPEDGITAYLFAHKASVEFSTIDLVVKDVKLGVFYGMSPISDDEIRKVVVQWATINAVGLLIRQPSGGSSVSTGPGTPSAPADTISSTRLLANSGRGRNRRRASEPAREEERRERSIVRGRAVHGRLKTTVMTAIHARAGVQIGPKRPRLPAPSHRRTRRGGEALGR
jgi:hypothetical protein